MPAPDWVTYVGAACGIVGALTGISGAVIGIVSYRRVSQMKALDLRVELRKLEVDTDELLQGLVKLLAHAHDSRLAVANASGWVRSGGMEIWSKQQAVDLSAVRALKNEFQLAADGFTTLTHEQLEAKLVEMYRLKATAQGYADKYHAEVAADDKEREHLKASARAVVAQMTRKPTV